MPEQENYITVYRSADTDAQEQARDVYELLKEEGLSPQIVGPDYPGVPIGTWEVRVPPDQVSRAEAILAAELDEEGHVKTRHDEDLELVPVFVGEGAEGEMQALAVRSVLDANNIPSVLVGTSVLPNLPFEVRVPKRFLQAARSVLQEARDLGPSGASEAEEAQRGSSPS